MHQPVTAMDSEQARRLQIFQEKMAGISVKVKKLIDEELGTPPGEMNYVLHVISAGWIAHLATITPQQVEQMMVSILENWKRQGKETENLKPSELH